jgi:hypothetical protein
VRIRSQEEQEKVIDGKEVDGVGVEEMAERSSGVMAWSGMIGETRRAMTGVRVSDCRFLAFVLPGFGIWRKMLELHRKLELNWG